MAEYAPDWTPYRFGFNNPILYEDALGLFENRRAAKDYAKENGIKTGLFRRNKINQNSDGSYSIDNRKERSSTTEIDGTVYTGGMVLEKEDSGAGALAVSALVVSQADSPAPGPADIVAVGMLATAGVMAIQDAIPLPEPDFSLPMPSFLNAKDNSKNEQHGDGGRAESKAEAQIRELQEQLKGASKKVAKKLRQKIKNISEAAKRKRKGENHSRNAKN